MPATTETEAFNATLHEKMLALGDTDQGAMDRALALANHEDARLDRILLRLGLFDEERLMPQVCAVLSVATATSAEGLQLDQKAADQLTTQYLTTQVVAPLHSPEGELRIAMADPGNATLIAELAFHLDRPITPVGVTTVLIRRLLASAGPSQADQGAFRDAQLARDQSTLRNSEIDGPVIKFVQETLADAVQSGASDIHFESAADGLTIRFRINGILVPKRVDPALSPAAILARLKVMSASNVAERRLPQDGRLNATIGGRSIDFRFSSLPTQLGESIVCRVLDPRALRLGWDKLGFGADVVEAVREIIERPSGLFLVTGPTGSGKTTTLYTALAHLNNNRRKIVTVEDPVEYNLPGIQQVQVHEEIGLTFARVLRSILRHDPNVILIGEIRDEETAQIACRAAQVGRMVLSTLHTNSADGAPTRLIDLGVPEFIVGEVLRGVLAQDLVTELCPECEGSGCAECSQTGAAARRLVASLKR